MRTCFRALLFLGCGVILFGMSFRIGNAAEPSAESSRKSKKSFDIHQRELWTTSNIQGSPEPPDPYTTQNAFPKLKLTEPLSVSLIPGTNRFGVATRPGKILSFEIDPKVERADVMLDLKRTIYGIAFHPRFEANGYIYVTSIMEPESTRGSRLSRFTATKPKGNAKLIEGSPVSFEADPASEVVILEWPSGGHNGGCIRFGADGFLYLATGDGSGIADGLQTGQDISDLLGSILRIDIDRANNQLQYSIPETNPFVNKSGARGEIWSFGHRQIWKFTFDSQQRLWAGEVGQDLWEMIYLVQRGGNYGWSILEGRHPFRPERTKGPADFDKPIVEHPHSDFRSITGGYVYESSRLPELKGAYIYGDYDTGKLWALKFDGVTASNGKLLEHKELADTQIRIVEFAQDRNGEVYLVDFAGGGFHRIEKAAPQSASKPFPLKLSETGLFSSTKDHIPSVGLIPYSVNAPLWSDGAEKVRYLALPGNTKIEFDDVIYPHGPTYPDVGWRFPDGTVLVKTFEMEMETGKPETRKRLETRILQHRKMPGNDDEYGAQYWYGYTYVWNDEQTDADLLPAEGLDRILTISDAKAPGGKREQKWRFPSRAECTLCHTMASKYVLGLTTLQMNKLHDYGGVTANQLSVLQDLGIFETRLPKSPDELPQLADYRDPGEPLHLRARSYLHANCAHCHRKWGGGNAEFELHASIPLDKTLAVGTKPGQGTFKLSDPRIIAPGSPERSMIVERMKLTGLGRMPHIASAVVDQDAIRVIEEWLASIGDSKGLDQPGAKRPRILVP